MLETTFAKCGNRTSENQKGAKNKNFMLMRLRAVQSGCLVTPSQSIIHMTIWFKEMVRTLSLTLALWKRKPGKAFTWAKFFPTIDFSFLISTAFSSAKYSTAWDIDRWESTRNRDKYHARLASTRDTCRAF